MNITIFTPSVEGLADNDFATIVYKGRLTGEEILELAYAWCVTNGGYVDCRVTDTNGDFFVEYKNDGDEKDEWSGDLNYSVSYGKLETK